jgi:hypothetical protein
MNRSIALFVALVTLLAHILAIHSDGNGNFAFPYDQAYTAYRVAHNVVFDAQWAWTPGSAGYESSPSVLWDLVAAIGERLSISVNLFCQTAGVLSMLVAVVLMAQFRERRTATLIAPLLLVTSGCIAAASASGMETATFTLLSVAAFLCFERALALQLAIALGLCVLTRPEGIVFTASLFAIACVDRSGPSGARRRALWPYAVPIVVLGIGMVVRAQTTGEVLPASFLALLHPHAGQLSDGLSYVFDFVKTSISPLLLVFPLAFLARGRLSGAGARALLLALVWTAMVAFQGRAPLPFSEAMVPALPFICLAIQEGMIEALDAGSKIVRKVALFALSLAILVSAMASKEPGDLGPIHVEQLHREWMSPSGSARYGYAQPLGRLGLEEEIRLTDRLRAVGLFLRDNVDPTSTVLTPWPSSMGYLSRLAVFDLLGRTNPMAGRERPGSWTRRERADVAAALEQAPDYVVPSMAVATRAPSLHEIAQALWLELDESPLDQRRLESIEHALASFEMITVPVFGYTRGATPARGEPFLLLRNRHLELHPSLEVAVEGGAVRVSVRHRGHLQLVDLRLEFDDDRGRAWFARPSGELTNASSVHARTGILLSAGTRAVDLVRRAVPEDLDGAKAIRVRAVLLNPNGQSSDPFATVSPEAVVDLP